MGATPADTEREIGHLRGDMTAALDEIERRVRGGLKGVASAEARVTSVRVKDDVLDQARSNPTLLGVGGMVVAGAIAYGGYALIHGLRERRKPQNRLRRRVTHVGHELGERVGERVEDSRKQLERARQRALLLKLEPQDGGYVRVADARVEPLAKQNKERMNMIKKLVWAGLLSVFMALGSVLARRLAQTAWQLTVHEAPPTAKSKAAS
jgi:hypothetical protein